MEDKRLVAFKRLLDIMDELREKCPWDREQTMESLRNCTIEETFELMDAVADKNYDEIRKELGDLMLHVVFYSKIGDEQGRFNITDVLNGVSDKLVYRHPHVFGDTQVNGTLQVVQNWEQLKLKEKQRTGGVLSGVPKSLPAMVKAFRIGSKAAAAGFDWEEPQEVWDKVREEIAEVEAEFKSGNTDNLESEFGDLLFSLVNVARVNNIDPEMALERTNKRFIERFNHVEKRANEAGKALKELPLEQMEEWWQEAKKMGQRTE